MSATLEILDTFDVEINGVAYSGKQGAAADNDDTPFEVTLTGQIHNTGTTLATATVAKAWDKDTHFPITFLQLYFWYDQDVYLQFVTAATNVIIKCTAKTPYRLTYNGLLAAANTTDITGGAEPTLAALDHINVGNYSGNTANYLLAVMN